VALDPDVEQVAPFVWAGGGDVVDDPDRPTSTTFADGATTEVLRQLQQLVHDPRLSGGRAAGRPDTGSAVQRFEAGRVGMVVGFRDLVPQLRATPGLHFDVMPLPRLPGEATLGSVRALCLARGAGHVAAAADFLAYAVGDRAARVLARTGFAMPSNLDAVNSPAFLQPGSQPRHARVFVDTVRDVRFLPSGPAWVRTREAIDRALAAIWGSPRAGALQSRLEALDRTSTRLLAPGQSSGSSTG
jgi:multiple sugar transport system substrate-binding protein